MSSEATRRRPPRFSTTADSTTNDSDVETPSKTTTTSSFTMPIKSALGSPSSSPFLPTRSEALVLAIYPLILLSGSIFSHLSPSVRTTTATYSPTHQSYQPPELAPSYFAQKRNLLNVWFVKLGWFWTTLSLALFVATHASFAAQGLSTQAALQKRLRAAGRWVAATTVWVGTTQWFFGPPLIDRSFRLTGGACEIQRANKAGIVDLSPREEIFTAAKCKVSGGTWSGGIDISGHVFLLILGSALLAFEIMPVVFHRYGIVDDRAVVLENGEVVFAHQTAGSAAIKSQKAAAKATSTGLAIKFIAVVLAIMCWMLLMTATFFHTWSEKLAGFVVALSGVWIIYFLPRGMPAVRGILGLPGI